MFGALCGLPAFGMLFAIAPPTVVRAVHWLACRLRGSVGPFSLPDVWRVYRANLLAIAILVPGLAVLPLVGPVDYLRDGEAANTAAEPARRRVGRPGKGKSSNAASLSLTGCARRWRHTRARRGSPAT